MKVDNSTFFFCVIILKQEGDLVSLNNMKVINKLLNDKFYSVLDKDTAMFDFDTWRCDVAIPDECAHIMRL